VLEKKAINKLQKGDILISHNLIRFCVCLLICCLVGFFFHPQKANVFVLPLACKDGEKNYLA